MTINEWRLVQLPLFAGLTDDILRRVTPHLHERTFSRGQTIA